MLPRFLNPVRPGKRQESRQSLDPDQRMIEVQSLTKKYPTRLAVDDVTFSVRQGEIVGFLGPNGAGRPRPCAS
jgi:ABC-2 type transport system ATP-binding protein